MKKTSTWIIALVAVIGLVFASCDTPEEKAAKAAQKAAGDLLKTLGGTDANAIAEALKTAGPTALAALTSTGGAPGGDFLYELNRAGDGIVITKYSGAGGTVIVPAEIEGYPVVSVGGFNGMFKRTFGGYAESNGGELITAVVLPDTVTRIENQAFGGCTNLHTINLPPNPYIGMDAFTDCENLYNLTIPDSITMMWYTFSYSKKLPLATRKRIEELNAAYEAAQAAKE